MSHASWNAGAAAYDSPVRLTIGQTGSSLKALAVPALKEPSRRKLRATGKTRQSNSSGVWISASGGTSTVPEFVTGTRLYQLKGSEGNSLRSRTEPELGFEFFRDSRIVSCGRLAIGRLKQARCVFCHAGCSLKLRWLRLSELCGCRGRRWLLELRRFRR